MDTPTPPDDVYMHPLLGHALIRYTGPPLHQEWCIVAGQEGEGSSHWVLITTGDLVEEKNGSHYPCVCQQDVGVKLRCEGITICDSCLPTIAFAEDVPHIREYTAHVCNEMSHLARAHAISEGYTSTHGGYAPHLALATMPHTIR